MSINLPTTTNPTRELIDVASIVEMLSPVNRGKMPTLRQALASAASYFAVEPAAAAVHVVCIKASGAIVLERIGKRGGHRTLWTFVQA